MRTLIVDSNSICYRLKFAMSEVFLSNENLETGIIFGFLLQIKKLAKKFNTNQFIFTWDIGGSFRKEISPEYKENRRKKKQVELDDSYLETFNSSCFKQFNIIREKVLPQLGFNNIFYQKGIEADDLIAQIVKTSTFEELPIVVSTDHDLYQLLDYCDICLDIKKPLFTHTSFIEKYKIPLHQWIEVKALSGDISDNIKGVTGVGEKTAIKYLLGKLPYLSKTGQSIASKVGKNTRELNLQLVTLPFPATKDITLKDTPKFNITDYLDVCLEYNFMSLETKKNIVEWKQLFHC